MRLSHPAFRYSPARCAAEAAAAAAAAAAALNSSGSAAVDTGKWGLAGEALWETEVAEAADGDWQLAQYADDMEAATAGKDGGGAQVTMG